MRESENRPRSARLACTRGPESHDSRAPVCIATSRVAPPATRWPTVHLPHATPRGREMRESENRPRSARRTCTCGPESDDSRAPVCIATSRVAPPATRWPTVHLSRATSKWSRNAIIREPAPQRALRLHTDAVPSRTTAVRRFGSPPLGFPLFTTRVPTSCRVGEGRGIRRCATATAVHCTAL